MYTAGYGGATEDSVDNNPKNSQYVWELEPNGGYYSLYNQLLTAFYCPLNWLYRYQIFRRSFACYFSECLAGKSPFLYLTPLVYIKTMTQLLARFNRQFKGLAMLL